MQIIPAAGALGAEIRGVDLRDDDLDFAAIYRAFLDYEVIFFRGVHLNEQEHLALGERFGAPSIFPVAKVMGATEPTMTVIKDGPSSPNSADRWHTDVTWIATPPKAALLHMEVCPERGGDTIWLSATRAYAVLSLPMQRFLCELSVVHSNKGFVERMLEKTSERIGDLVSAIRRDYPPVTHPLVRTHPETAKRSLLYARNFISHIENLQPDESDAVLAFLARHIENPALQCRWHWQPGDLAIWDERSTLHRAAADHWPQQRVVRRLEIDGDRPYFDPEAVTVTA